VGAIIVLDHLLPDKDIHTLFDKDEIDERLWMFRGRDRIRVAALLEAIERSTSEFDISFGKFKYVCEKRGGNDETNTDVTVTATCKYGEHLPVDEEMVHCIRGGKLESLYGHSGDTGNEGHLAEDAYSFCALVLVPVNRQVDFLETMMPSGYTYGTHRICDILESPYVSEYAALELLKRCVDRSFFKGQYSRGDYDERFISSICTKFGKDAIIHPECLSELAKVETHTQTSLCPCRKVAPLPTLMMCSRFTLSEWKQWQGIFEPDMFCELLRASMCYTPQNIAALHMCILADQIVPVLQYVTSDEMIPDIFHKISKFLPKTKEEMEANKTIVLLLARYEEFCTTKEKQEEEDGWFEELRWLCPMESILLLGGSSTSPYHSLALKCVHLICKLTKRVDAIMKGDVSVYASTNGLIAQFQAGKHEFPAYLRPMVNTYIDERVKTLDQELLYVARSEIPEWLLEFLKSGNESHAAKLTSNELRNISRILSTNGVHQEGGEPPYSYGSYFRTNSTYDVKFTRNVKDYKARTVEEQKKERKLLNELMTKLIYV